MSTSLVCQKSPQTYRNSMMRSRTKSHSLSLLYSSGTPYWIKFMMKDVRSGETCWKTSTSPWVTIRRLGVDNVSPPVVTTVTADQFANQLLSNGRRVEHRRTPDQHHKTIVPSNNQPPTELTKHLSLDDLASGLTLLKPGKLLVWMIY